MTVRNAIGPGALAFLAIGLLLLAGGRSSFLRDPGTFWHVSTGEHILSEGFIRTDSYTFTFAGSWWVPYQWLGEVVMALVHRAGGFDSLLLGAVAILAATFAWMAVRIVNTGLHPVVVGAIVLLAIAASASHFHVRPHLFTIAAMALTTAVLIDVDTGRHSLRRMAWLIPLFIFWTNVHGGVLGGMATVAMTAVGWSMARALGLPTPLRTVRDVAWVLGVALACGATALVNPYGLDLIRTWIIILGEPALKEIIQEHSRLDPTQPYAWPVLALGASYAFLLAGIRPRELRITWLLPIVWFVLACDRVRHAPLFAVSASICIASVWPQTRWARWVVIHRPDFYVPTRSDSEPSFWSNVCLPTAVVLSAFLLQLGRVTVPVVGAGWARHDADHWPVALLNSMKAHEPARSDGGNHLFNDYIDGGFAIYHVPGYKVFVDDRCELFGGEWLTKFVAASAVDTAGAIARWEQMYGRFDFALTRFGTGFDDYFAESESWRLIEKAATASFYKRK